MSGAGHHPCWLAHGARFGLWRCRSRATAAQVCGQDQAEHGQQAGGEQDGPGSQRGMDVYGQDGGGRGQPVSGAGRHGDEHAEPERHPELVKRVHQPGRRARVPGSDACDPGRGQRGDKAGEIYPACTGGKGACPPEDAGGYPGYQQLKEILADPSNEEYEEVRDWADSQVHGEFDPASFDLAKANARVSIA
jgi:Plasmid pRiA4b ORF-3-like protein